MNALEAQDGKSGSTIAQPLAMRVLAGYAGEVKPLEMPPVDDRVATHLRSMASLN